MAGLPQVAALPNRRPQVQLAGALERSGGHDELRAQRRAGSGGLSRIGSFTSIAIGRLDHVDTTIWAIVVEDHRHQQYVGRQ